MVDTAYGRGQKVKENVIAYSWGKGYLQDEQIYNKEKSLTFYNLKNDTSFDLRFSIEAVGLDIREKVSQQVTECFRMVQPSIHHILEIKDSTKVDDIDASRKILIIVLESIRWNAQMASSILIVGNENRTAMQMKDGKCGVVALNGFQHGKCYWEIKIESISNGMYVGVSLQDGNVELGHNNGRFWGIECFSGYIVHNNNRQEYTKPFHLHDTIGVLLDGERGSLSFYRNKIHLGKAFTNLPNQMFYPMAQMNRMGSRISILPNRIIPENQ